MGIIRMYKKKWNIKSAEIYKILILINIKMCGSNSECLIIGFREFNVS